MKHFVFVALFLLFSLTQSACFDEDTSVPQNNPNEVFFRQNCAVCHGAKGEGKQVGEKYAPDLKSEKIVNDTDEKLFQQISNGGGGMPAFKYQLTDDQIKEMIQFIRKEIQKKK